MKFYISAKWQMKDTVSEMIKVLKEKGHEITADWTTRASERNYGGGNAEQSEKFSQEELEAILRADIFIHLSDLGGKGKYVDLGIALAGNKIRGIPREIYVVGKTANESQYYFNQAIITIATERPVTALEMIVGGL